MSDLSSATSPAAYSPAATATGAAADVAAAVAPDADVARCANCDGPLGGAFCQRCGQEVRATDPTLRELATELVAELGGLDGKVLGTLGRLVRRPGALTVDHLAGRRARHVSPLRIYLLCSVIFFATAAVVPEPKRVIADAATRQTGGVANVGGSDAAERLVRDEVARLRGSASRWERWIGDVAVRQLDHRAELETWRAEAAPKLMFVLVPAFAALTAAVFRRRMRYPGHVVFALHVHAFAFLALLPYEAGRALDRIAPLTAGLTLSAVLSVGYLVLALRRAFALTTFDAVVRGLLVATAYTLLLSAAVAVATIVRVATL